MQLRTEIQILTGARLAIFNTEKNADRQKRMAVYGLTPKRLQEGKDLLKNAEQMKEVKTSYYDDRWAISQQLKADRQAALTLFKDHVIVARTAFRKDEVVLYNLKVQRISKKTSEWPLQALHFYTKLEDHVTSMEPFGITSDVIAQAKASMQALIELKEDRIDRKGLAQDSTQEKRKAFRALKDWVMEFRGIARLAFKDNPQILEVFGITVTAKV